MLTMKDLNKLEAHIKSLAEKQQSTPPPMVWTEIDKALPKKKNNRKDLFFLFLIGALIIVFSIAQFDLLNLKSNKNIERSYSEKSHTAQEVISKSANLNVITQTDSEINKESSLQETMTKSEDIEQGALKEKKIIPEKKNAANNAKNSMLKTQQDLTSLISSIQTKNKESESNESESNFNIIKKRKKSTVSNERNKSKLSFNSKPSKQLANQNKLANNLIKSTNQKMISGLPLSENASMTYLLGIKLIEPSFFPIMNRKSPEIKFDRYHDTSFEGTNSSSDRSKYFLEIASIIGFHDTHLDNEQGSTNTYRSDTESNWYTWGTRLAFGYHLTNSLYLKTGLEFIESRDKFSFEKEMIQLLESTSNFSVVQGSYFNRGDITYRQWNIPLTIGIEKQKGKLIYGLEGSALFNLRFKSEGKVQVGEFDFSRVENEAIYKNSLGLGYRAALMLGINLTERNALYFKPSYAQYLSVTNLKNALVNSKLSQYYLEVAFKKRF